MLNPGSCFISEHVLPPELLQNILAACTPSPAPSRALLVFVSVFPSQSFMWHGLGSLNAGLGITVLCKWRAKIRPQCIRWDHSHLAQYLGTFLSRSSGHSESFTRLLLVKNPPLVNALNRDRSALWLLPFAVVWVMCGLLYLFWVRVYVVQVGHKFPVILLPQSPNFWDYRDACLAFILLASFSFGISQI